MKKITAVLSIVLFAACNSNKQKEVPANNSTPPHQHTTMPAATAPQKKFAGIEFENTQDYVCGMPVRAGVNDTAHYKNKVYGFCAKECKEEFLKNPKQYVTAKK